MTPQIQSPVRSSRVHRCSKLLLDSPSCSRAVISARYTPLPPPSSVSKEKRKTPAPKLATSPPTVLRLSSTSTATYPETRLTVSGKLQSRQTVPDSYLPCAKYESCRSLSALPHALPSH